MHLHPDAVVTPEDLQRAQHHLVRDSAWASVTGALSGGVVLAGFALALGAGPFLIGLLSAIPFLVQAVQLPATVFVERVRQRKRIGVVGLTVARVLILGLALLPLVSDPSVAVPLVLLAQLAICGLSSFSSCAVNSWFHQLLPRETLGTFFSRRLLAATVLGSAFTLVVGWLLEHPPLGRAMLGYVVAFALAGLAGLTSSWHLAMSAEPRMTDAGPHTPMRDKLRAPFRDRNFRRLLVLLGAWNVASNLSAPFLTVYLIRQLHYGMGTVTSLWVTSQVANALTLYAWGRVSDRTSNKAILAVAMPAYFVCALGLVFTRVGAPYGLQLALLYVVHAAMGAAGGGIGLATGNLGLKLAPQGQGTAFLAAVGLVNAIAGGLAPLVGGVLGEWLQSSQLSVVIRWVSSVRADEVAVLRFAHLEFLFAGTAALGLYVLHTLSRIDEGTEVSERRVMQELGMEAMRSMNQLSSLGGMMGSVFAFDRLSERRRFSRRHGRAGA